MAYSVLRLGIVGFGRVVEWYHLPALDRSREWRLVSVSEPVAQRQQWLRTNRPGVNVFDSAEALLNGPNLDALLIATPPASHHTLARQALDAGLHVLVEKPMALNSEQATVLLAAAQSSNRQLWVGFNRRFRQPYQHAQRWLARFPAAQFESARFTMLFDSGRWRAGVAPAEADVRGEGVLDDVASHQIDLLGWIFGRQATAVRCEPDINLPASGNGVRYTLRFGDGIEAVCSAAHGQGYREQLELRSNGQRLVVYPAGTIAANWLPQSAAEQYAWLHTKADLLASKLMRHPSIAAASFAQQLHAFGAAIQQPQQPSAGADAAAGLHSVAVIDACRHSLAAGGTWQPVAAQQPTGTPGIPIALGQPDTQAFVAEGNRIHATQ